MYYLSPANFDEATMCELAQLSELSSPFLAFQGLVTTLFDSITVLSRQEVALVPKSLCGSLDCKFNGAAAVIFLLLFSQYSCSACHR